MSILESIRAEAQRTGGSRSKFIYFRDGDKKRIRFLNDMEDAVEVPMHKNFELGINVPCQKVFGRECSYDDDDEIRTRNNYAWSVYDYDDDDVKIFMFPANNYSPLPPIVAMYEEYGTMCDRDYVISLHGKGLGKQFGVIPQDKSKFRVKNVRPYSKSALLKLLDKAFPDEHAPHQATFGAPSGSMDNLDASYDVDDSDEGSTSEYEVMAPKKLYQLCKEREIECEPKKPKAYYVNLLKEWDAQQDDWGDSDDDSDDDSTPFDEDDWDA